MKIRELMTTNPTTAQLNATLDEIATIMRQEDVGSVPIVDDDELVGMVTDRDIVVRCVAEGGDTSESTAEDILSEGLVTISPDADVQEGEELMSRHQIRRLPVVSDGRLEGMISLGDLAVKAREKKGPEEVLEHVSTGVKRSSQRVAPRAQRTGEEDQGISNRSASAEKERQQRVVPIKSGERSGGAPRNPKRKSG
ncbi:MAG: CBS domain-containing protein [Acidobacteriaceae bacterium]